MKNFVDEGHVFVVFAFLAKSYMHGYSSIVIAKIYHLSEIQ